jgi:hypothetical protein
MQGAVFYHYYYLLDYTIKHTRHVEIVISTYFYYYSYYLEIPKVDI